MSKISSSPDFGNVVDLEALKRWVTIWAGDVTGQVNGGIDFTNNIYCKILDVSFTVANSNLLVSHSLGKIPTGYFLVKTNVSANIYTGSTDWTSSIISLKSTAIATCKIIVF